MCPPKKANFWVISTTNPNLNPFLPNTSLVNEFILIILRLYNRKETDNVSIQKKEKNC
jgi:hypothetical protein